MYVDLACRMRCNQRCEVPPSGDAKKKHSPGASLLASMSRVRGGDPLCTVAQLRRGIIRAGEIWNQLKGNVGLVVSA